MTSPADDHGTEVEVVPGATAGDADLFGELASIVGSAEPNGRAALLSAFEQGGRLHRFADTVAQMLDVAIDDARKMLDCIDRPSSWEETPFPNLSIFHVDGGPTVEGAITGFVRIDDEGIFPEHSHNGTEAVLIVQGRCHDSFDGRILRPGDVGKMLPESGKHEVTALPGPPLVYLAVVFEAIKIGEAVFGPDVL